MFNFNPKDYDYIVRWQSDLVNTKESILPVCDKPNTTNKWILQKWDVLEKKSNYAFRNKHLRKSKEM